MTTSRAIHRRHARRAALQVSLIYLGVSTVWILASDPLLLSMGLDRTTLLRLSIAKGLGCLWVTGVLLYGLVFWSMRRLGVAEERRRESEEQFRNAFENAVTGMALIAPDLRFLRVNDVLCEMLGYTREELLALRVPDVTHPEDVAARVRNLERLLAGGAEAKQLAGRSLRKDGRVVRVLANSRLQRDEGGRPLYLITQVMDVTARHEAEEAARQRQIELAHAARLVTLGELASGLAHEINQPLGAILHYGEAMQAALRDGAAGGDGEASLREAVDDVVRQAGRAAATVRRLRRFARKQEPQAREADLNDLVREAAELLAPQAAIEGVRVRLDLGEGLPAVVVDPLQVQQVLTNLLSNGIEAVAGLPADSRWVSVATRAEDEDVFVTVRDGGPGVPAPDLERLFQSFFTTKAQGLGLGLAISRSLMDAHGGRLTYRRGEAWTEFECRLPVAARARWLIPSPSSG